VHPQLRVDRQPTRIRDSLGSTAAQLLDNRFNVVWRFRLVGIGNRGRNRLAHALDRWPLPAD
jgi:hypothetical protein